MHKNPFTSKETSPDTELMSGSDIASMIFHIAPLVSTVSGGICWWLGWVTWIWPVASAALSVAIWGPTLLIAGVITGASSSYSAYNSSVKEKKKP